MPNIGGFGRLDGGGGVLGSNVIETPSKNSVFFASQSYSSSRPA